MYFSKLLAALLTCGLVLALWIAVAFAAINHNPSLPPWTYSVTYFPLMLVVGNQVGRWVLYLWEHIRA